MGYASKRINSDPEPFIGKFGDSSRSAVQGGGFEGESLDYEPRPEYDNNYNPILIAYRTGDLESEQVMHPGAFMLTGAWVGDRQVAERHIEHAREVLSRLATFKMSQPEGKA